MAIDSAQAAGDIIFLADRATQGLTFGAAELMSEELLRGHRGHGAAAAAAVHAAVIGDVGGVTHMDGYETAIRNGFVAGAPYAAVPSNVRKAAARAAKLAWDTMRAQHRCDGASSRDLTSAMFDATQTDPNLVATQGVLAASLAAVLVPATVAADVSNLVADVMGFSWSWLNARWLKMGIVPAVAPAMSQAVHQDAAFAARVATLAGHLNV
jgi:hypothetical protein